jgi:hypothetical protein
VSFSNDRRQIVDRDSASLGIANEIAVPVQGADRRSICKFEAADSQKYKPIYNESRLIGKRLETSNSLRISSNIESSSFPLAREVTLEKLSNMANLSCR